MAGVNYFFLPENLIVAGQAEHARIEFACEALGDLANRGDGIKGQIQRGYPLAVVSATVERGSGA